MEKQEMALEVIKRLKEEYPDADCTLDYNEAWKLLVSVRLAAQCTDARVNIVVEKLYEKYPDVDALAKAEPEQIEEIVRPCGLGKSKSRDISACMRMLKEKYNGKVPDDFNELLKLPGVGRKSANLIMVTRQPPHIPVPSIITGFIETVVGMLYCSVSLQTNFIITSGPIAITSSNFSPASISFLSISVTKP